MNEETKRYYFHVRWASETVLDLEGTELSSIEDAREHALMDARCLMSIAVLEGRDISARRVEIVDDAGNRLLVVDFREALTAEDDL